MFSKIKNVAGQVSYICIIHFYLLCRYNLNISSCNITKALLVTNIFFEAIFIFLTCFNFIQSMAYMVCGIMDKGFKDFQLEAAISKIYASVCVILLN